MAQATSRASSSRARSSGSSSGRRTSSGGGRSSASAQSNGRSRVKDAIVPVTSVVLGAAAGVVLGQMQARRRKRVLGIPVPGTGRGADGLAKSIGEAGKQLARLADEVNTSRRKAEEVGKALS
jgi:hypothetical protein